MRIIFNVIKPQYYILIPTAEAMFFHVLDPKDELKHSNKKQSIMFPPISEYIVVVNENDSVLNLFVPSMLRDALYRLWSKTVRRWLIQTLTAETYQSLVKLFVSKNNKAKNTTKLYALRSSAKRVSMFFKEAERFHRESKTKALYIRDMLYNQSFKAQPRPMSTIAVEPGSGLELLTQDVQRFWNQRKKLEQNDLPFQRVHLLHGPPGNGKSSILQALAIQYEIPYFYLDCNACSSVETLRMLLTRYTTHERCLVVIEDAESAMPNKIPTKHLSSNKNGKNPKNAAENTNNDDGDDDDDEDEDDQEDKISVKEFIELINGSQSPRPAGRLICLTTNTLEALPAEVLQLVNSQGNLFEFPNAGKATMKGYWKNFYQSDSYWDEFWMHYTSIWVHPIELTDTNEDQDNEENDPNDPNDPNDQIENDPNDPEDVEIIMERLHSAADLQKYCMRFRNRPGEASTRSNVLTFVPSSNTKNKDQDESQTAAEADVATEAMQSNIDNLDNPLKPIPLTRQGSHTFALHHNIPHHEASKILDAHDREWAQASFALKAQQIKIFETNRTAIILPLLNNDIRLLATTGLSLLLMGLGISASTFLSKFMATKTLTTLLLVLPASTASWSWYEKYERKTHINFILEEKANIGCAMAKYLSRRISHMTSKFAMQPLIASHLRQGPLESNAKNFEAVIHITDQDGPQAFCLSTKDKTASVQPVFQTEKWMDLTINLPTLNQSNPSNPSKESIKSNEAFVLHFMVEKLKRIVLHEETRQERMLRKQIRGYVRKDVGVTKLLKLCIERKENTKILVQQLLQMALEEHAADELNQTIKILQIRVIEGKLMNPNDTHYQQMEIFASTSYSSEIKRLEDHSFHWPLDDISFNRNLKQLVDDAVLFDKSKEFYTLRGIPFRRSYLLSGPEASGKNYFVRYLAHRLGREICSIDFSKTSHRRMSNAGLAMAVNSLGSNAILIMRNLDCLVSIEGGAGRGNANVRMRSGYSGRGRNRKGGSRTVTPLTYSGILNVLDGPTAHNNGLITIMTTLKFDKLLEDTRTVTALLRAGRCAKHVKFQMPTKIQVQGLFKTMFDTTEDEGKDQEQAKEKEKKQEEENTKKNNIHSIIQVANAFVNILQNEEEKYETRKKKADLLIQKEIKENEEREQEQNQKNEEKESQKEQKVQNEEKDEGNEYKDIDGSKQLRLSISSPTYPRSNSPNRNVSQSNKQLSNKYDIMSIMNDISSVVHSHSFPSNSQASSAKCWTSVVDWDSIKGYLRPLLHKGHGDAANKSNVLLFLKTQQKTKRQRLNQQMDIEMEKVDEALRLNPKRKADVLKRESSSFDAQSIYDQIISKSTGWASLLEIQLQDEILFNKMTSMKEKLSKLKIGSVATKSNITPQCRHGHPLKRGIDVFHAATCDGSKGNGDPCKGRLSRGKVKYSCKSYGCDYDVCKSCYLRMQKKLKKAKKEKEKEDQKKLNDEAKKENAENVNEVKVSKAEKKDVNQFKGSFSTSKMNNEGVVETKQEKKEGSVNGSRSIVRSKNQHTSDTRDTSANITSPSEHMNSKNGMTMKSPISPIGSGGIMSGLFGQMLMLPQQQTPQHRKEDKEIYNMLKEVHSMMKEKTVNE